MAEQLAVAAADIRERSAGMVAKQQEQLIEAPQLRFGVPPVDAPRRRPMRAKLARVIGRHCRDDRLIVAHRAPHFMKCRRLGAGIEQKIEDRDLMRELTKKLRIGGVSAVVHPFHGDSLGGEEIDVEIAARRRTAEVERRPGGSADRQQPLALGARHGVVSRPPQGRGNPEQSAEAGDEPGIDLAQMPFAGDIVIEGPDPRRQGFEMRGTLIVHGQAPPMLLRPWLRDLGLVDRLEIAALGDDRDRQPLHALRRLDLVAVAPVAPGELRVVQEDELVHHGHDVEIALPGNVARLDDGEALAFGPFPAAHPCPPR